MSIYDSYIRLRRRSPLNFLCLLEGRVTIRTGTNSLLDSIESKQRLFVSLGLMLLFRSFFHIDATKSRASMHHFGMQNLLSSFRNIIQPDRFNSNSAKLVMGEGRGNSGKSRLPNLGQGPLHPHSHDHHFNVSDLTLSKRPFFGSQQVHPDPLWNDLERGVINVEDSYHDSADDNEGNGYDAIPEEDEDADAESVNFGSVRSFNKEDYGPISCKIVAKNEHENNDQISSCRVDETISEDALAANTESSNAIQTKRVNQLYEQLFHQSNSTEQHGNLENWMDSHRSSVQADSLVEHFDGANDRNA